MPPAECDAALPDPRVVLAPLRGGVGPCREASDAGGSFRRGTREIVTAAAGMGVEVEETLVLSLQGREQREERHVLVHVGEVAGVEAMSVLHRAVRVTTPV